MKNITYITLFTFAILFASCSSSKKTTTTEVEKKDSDLKELIVDKNFRPADSSDYTISNVVLKANYMTMDVTYKGGCGVHKFDLYFTGNYAKSLPVKASVFLKHTKENETCDKVITENIRFDIKNIQYKKDKTVIVKIKSVKESFTYKY